MQIGQYELNVRVSGRNIPEYGDGRNTYVEGREGEEFTLRFRNSTAGKVLVVPTIDGKSVLDGESVDPGGENSGYVVAAYLSCEIKGWRRSLDESAKFVFADKSKSYAAGSGSGEENCGVVGALVYTEDSPPVIHHHHYHGRIEWVPYPYPVYPTYPFYPSPCTPCPSWTFVASQTTSGVGDVVSLGSTGSNHASSAVQATSQPEFTLGTAFGEDQADRVVREEFKRGVLAATFLIYYTDAASLRKAGLLNKRSALSLPQAFQGFCKPPPSSKPEK